MVIAWRFSEKQGSGQKSEGRKAVWVQNQDDSKPHNFKQREPPKIIRQ